MQQIKVRASQEYCWQMLSEPESWHQWAPWLLIDVVNPHKGSRIKSRFLPLPLPGKITVWQPCWRWDWRWGTLTWKHRVERIDQHNSLITISVSGLGKGLVELFYGPIMDLALRRFRLLAEQGYQAS
jgi:hypothetical protein